MDERRLEELSLILDQIPDTGFINKARRRAVVEEINRILSAR